MATAAAGQDVLAAMPLAAPKRTVLVLQADHLRLERARLPDGLYFSGSPRSDRWTAKPCGVMRQRPGLYSST